ncbi:RNA-splicing ligase RtcB [Anaerohalosphaera lusitana]|uniref:tRNA-splicing ligase RtcB n=1 Tax=Anaerohalosphaera lusitana TaxID=1936003 RepID=A0A1U9NM45_9BACT|nr:RtcB family protein [Anaerohalosphaera lusitana]AQT68576.1 RNA-splicing ligase RtcB [Anaerohalosphaera lusitana]
MDTNRLTRISKNEWRIEPHGKMNVPGIIYATAELIEAMDDKVFDQVRNVAQLPGIVQASYAMPDAHWGYGFCIGGVAAFDPDKGGVVSAGGVGFDIACGVRTLHTNLTAEDIASVRKELAEALFRHIPAGVGSTGKVKLSMHSIDDVLTGGAKWAVEHGYGLTDDLRFIEENGCMPDADQSKVSDHAKKRQLEQVGTLGSGNHYLEVQVVDKIYDPKTAKAFGIHEGDVKISIHCGSRGLGHQIGTDYLKSMATAANSMGIDLPERELACARLDSPIGLDYLGAMAAGVNCAMANRQVITHLVRQAVEKVLPKANIRLLYDVSHNTCKREKHTIQDGKKSLYVHRKGATRAFGPGDPSLPREYKDLGQPVLIGGTMGTASHILVGTEKSRELSFGSACHGAGRTMSRRSATKRWQGKSVVNQLAGEGVLIRSKSLRGVAEEAPGAYKDVDAVVESAQNAGLANRVARLVPVICVKG